jgi:pimeloyl-ACP methyl ester carboxylesterase
MTLALHSSVHPRISLRNVRVPTTFVAGRWDVLAGSHEMDTAARRIPGARYVELNASHFVPMERPAEVHQLLLELVAAVSRSS